MENISENKLKWIKTGYSLFGEIGREALNAEKLSSLMGRNRSSFYHYFRDMEIFESHLLRHHVERFDAIGKTIEPIQTFTMEVIEIIVRNKEEMAFHRQLIVHESYSRYKDCFNEAKQRTEPILYRLWDEHINENNGPTHDLNLYRAIRDYFLVHNQQSKENDVHDSLNSILQIFGQAPEG